jgi:hypothetical protein
MPEKDRSGESSRLLKAAPWLALLALASQEAFAVEDGQFTREYSRLYTALVLGVGLLGLLGVVALLVSLLRAKR